MSLDAIIDWVYRLLHTTLVTVGKTAVTPVLLAKFLVCVCVVFLLERVFRRWCQGILKHTQLDAGMRFAVSRFFGYGFVAAGLYIAFLVVGLDLGGLAVVLGAVGIGIGFGLQNVAGNFVSGLIILAERPISVGDYVEIEGVLGKVERINLRSTVVVTNDNVSVIVPNTRFIEQTVVNWTHSGTRVRINIPVGVAYGTDTDFLRETLLAVARANPEALTDPEPHLFFKGFGDSSLDFELGVWIKELQHTPRRFRSDMNYAIEKALRKAGIEIPFPQRDLHVRSGRLEVSAPPPKPEK